MKAASILSLILMSTFAVGAQSDEFKRAEFFAGYSYAKPKVNFGSGPVGQSVYQERTSQHGFNGAAVVNVSRYFGIKGDVSGTYASKRYAFPVATGISSNPTVTVMFTGNTSIHNFLGGVQVKDNSTEARVTPFAHALIGAARRNNKIEGGPFACVAIIPCPTDRTETAFAGAFGGGLDVRLSKRVSLRIFQADYNPVKFNAGTDHNFRFSTGIVLR